MTCSDLANRVARRSGFGDLRSEQVVDAIFDCLRSAMERGERIELRGFGTFTMRSYRAYRGRNPKTGATIDVEPKRMPHFKPSGPLGARLNSTKERLRPAKAAPGEPTPLSGDLAGADDSP
jgi:integration host factor subunit beta